MTYTIVPLTMENYECFVRESGSNLPALREIQLQDKRCSSETILHRIGLVTPEGRLLGFAMAVTGSWDPILRPGYFEVNVSVDMDWRRRGLGKKLYAEVVKFCSEHQAVALQTMIGETQHEGIAWAERRGFTKELHTFTSELDLSRFQPNVLMDSLSTAEANGFRFTSLAEYPQDDESFRRFADFYWDLVLDAPGMEEKPRPSFEEMKPVS